MKRALTCACAALTLAASATAQSFVYVPDNVPSSGGSNAIPFWAEWSAIQGEIRFQELYTAAQLGNMAFTIQDVAMASNYNGTFGAQLFEIRAAHSTSTMLVQTMDTNIPNPVTLFNGPTTIATSLGQWAPFGTTATFAYNGTDSLVLDIRYKGGVTTSIGGGGSQGRFVSAAINRAWAYGNFNATSWSGSDFAAGIKTRFTVTTTDLTGTGSISIGGMHSFTMSSPANPGRNVQMGTSLGAGPTPIGTRSIGLTVDSLLIASIGGNLPTVFAGYSNSLSAAGRASAQLNIPTITALIGLDLHHAFIVFDAAAPGGIADISNTYSFKVSP